MKYKVKIISTIPVDWEDTYIIELDKEKNDITEKDIMDYVYENNIDPEESEALNYNFGNESDVFINSIEKIE